MKLDTQITLFQISESCTEVIRRSVFFSTLIVGFFLVAGCASNSTDGGGDFPASERLLGDDLSYLNEDPNSNAASSVNNSAMVGSDAAQSLTDEPVNKILKPIQTEISVDTQQSPIYELFSTLPSVKVTADKMPLSDFIHYVFGRLLKVNYILDETVEGLSNGESPVTFNISTEISALDLFSSVSDLMADRGLQITYGKELFYIHRTRKDARTVKTIGIGASPSDVPETRGVVLQLVPLRYGIKLNLERRLNDLVRVKITPDRENSALFIEGDRANVLRSLDLIALLDVPASRGRYIGLIQLSYLSAERFTEDVTVLLANEGIDAGVGRPNDKNVVMVPLPQLGGVVVFASDEVLLDRVRYWAEQIDEPGQDGGQEYFVYYPKKARASDLGESLRALLTGERSNGEDGRKEQRSTGNAPSAARIEGLSSDDVKMVVDERSNVLIFHTAGSEYRALLPLLETLDTLPRQIMLDITIAEVTLQDEFKYGVEWALSRSEVQLTTDGAFGVTDFGGLGLNINGGEGPLVANFINSNSLVKVLSNPTLMVLDGKTASINVGSNISVVGATTQDPLTGQRQTTTSEYRQTGVTISVSPTVSASGIVVMTIDQSISNSVPSSSGSGGNPDIFERSVSTEVVAQSGQTVMLAGLVSENLSRGGSGAPGLSKLPIVGELFKSTSDSRDRTELVMLVTPKVVEDLENWDHIIKQFRAGLSLL